MMIADFSRAMENKDYVALSKCFAGNCRMFDYCPNVIGKESHYIHGNLAVEMFYHNRFVLGGFKVLDPQIMDERSVNFYGVYNGSIIHALATIEAYDPKTGLIREMIVRPA